MFTTPQLMEKAQEAARGARVLSEKSDLTAADRSEFDRLYASALDFKAQADVARKDEDVLDAARRLGALVGGGDDQSRASRWAKAAAKAMTTAMPEVEGQKALVSGTIGVQNVIEPAVVRIGTVPLAILDLLPIAPAASDGRGGNTFTYLRQNVRTNNAAPVADGTLKPTSLYTMAEIEDRFRVIAHLSEPTPLRYFADHDQLENFLQVEMEFGLRTALEAQVVAGTGIGENLTGLLNTSGIVSVAAVTGDLLATLRKAITSLQVNGNIPTAFVVSPADAEKLDLIREGASTGQYLLGGPGSKTDQTLWSIPRVPSTAVAAGTALLGDWNFAEVVVRQGATVAVDTGGDNFTKNLATMRVEGRFGFAVKRPSAFAKITLP